MDGTARGSVMSSYWISGRMNNIRVNVEIDRYKELTVSLNASFGDGTGHFKCN